MQFGDWWSRASGDEVLRRLFKNLAYLFSASVVVAIVGVATVVVTARALGPVGLGVVALIEAYVRAVDQIFRIEPWQAVVRYGAKALEFGDDNAFRRLIKFATLFDLFGSLMATGVAIGAAALVAPWLQLSEEQTPMLMLFAATLSLSWSSTPTGVLRLFDKFDVLAKLSVVTAIVRFLLSVVAWWLGGDVWSFIYVLAIGQIVDQLLPFVFAWRELRIRRHSGIWATPLRGVVKENEGILRFIANANVNVIARQSTHRLDTLIVGALLGPANTGFYQIAKRAGQAALRLGRPLQQAVYPDIARLWARGEIARFRRLVLRVNYVLGGLAAVILALTAFNMDGLVRLIFGAAFVPAASPMTAQVAAVVLFLFGVALNPALLSMGQDRALARVTLTATFVFFGSLFPLIFWFGTLGASLGHVLFNLLWLAGLFPLFLRHTSPGTIKASK